MKVSLVQFNGVDDDAANLERAAALVRAAVTADSPDLVILPEMSAFTSGDPAKTIAGAQPLDGAFATAMSALAAELKVNLHAGSIIEQRGGRRFNTSIVFGRNGEPIGQYSKIHRFDVSLPNGVEVRESSLVDAGNEVVVRKIDDVLVGFSICYDLRFAELYRKLVDAGASLIVVPSAFIQNTGMDHWEVLLRARAIETQCYVAAPNQIGQMKDGPLLFGHSMIVDPWGLVIGQMSNNEGFVTARLDLDYLRAVRQRIPISQHRILV